MRKLLCNRKEKKKKTEQEKLNAEYRKLPVHNNQADNLVPKHVLSHSAMTSMDNQCNVDHTANKG